MIFNSIFYAGNVAVNLINRSSVWLVLAFLLSASGISFSAPPNPYLYFDIDNNTGSITPKSSSGQNAELGILKYMQALDGCCLAKEQSILQPDGIEYVLTLKIDFSDQPGRRSSTEFNQYLFADTGVSLKTYYRENSYNQMDVQPGPVGGVLPAGNTWIRAQKPMGYYGDGIRNVPRYRELITEACVAVDDTVDFTKYDRDKDGIVDHLFIIHSGNDEASTGETDDIWSILTPSVNAIFDGVRVDTAIVVAEEPDFDRPHLGIYFHEFFHDFGAPDVYGQNFIDSRDHKWGLMGQFGPFLGPEVFGVGNGLGPAHIMGYLKWDFDARPENGRVGWIEPVNITHSGQVSVSAFELSPKTDILFKIDIPHARPLLGNESTLPNNATNREFFLIENRYKASGATFDTYLPESGILIWHIDETQVRSLFSYDAGYQIWLEDPNDPEHLGIHPEDSGIININTITEGAAYSADDDQTAFTPGTLPNSSANNGTPTGISITNISSEGMVMQMLVSFGDTYEPNDTLETAFPIYYGQPYHSFLYDASDTYDYYQIEAAAGMTIRATLSVIPSDLDYRLSLLTATGETVATGKKSPDALEYQILYQPTIQQTLYPLVTTNSGFSNVASYKLFIEQLDPGPFEFVQTRVYPNPFRSKESSMTFAYQLFPSQSANTISLEIFTVTGEKVYGKTHNDRIAPREFHWDGSNLLGNPLAAGTYIYQISASQADTIIRDIGKFIILR